MQFMVILRRRTEVFSQGQFAELLDAEADRIARLYAEGMVRSAWSRGDVPGAVLLIEAPDPAAAERAIASLPLVKRDMLDLQIIDLLPYRGFVPTD
jgi:muconolactone delta-isomerase